MRRVRCEQGFTPVAEVAVTIAVPGRAGNAADTGRTAASAVD